MGWFANGGFSGRGNYFRLLGFEQPARLIFADATFGVSPTSKKPNQNPNATRLV